MQNSISLDSRYVELENSEERATLKQKGATLKQKSLCYAYFRLSNRGRTPTNWFYILDLVWKCRFVNFTFKSFLPEVQLYVGIAPTRNNNKKRKIKM